jgi:hypothetical protein|tara:strand:- start:194 stop:412 length:219 start_codon:yes stop_codon:yes gene_type:complete
MGNKKKAKKISAKKEKYAKFRKDKPSTMDLTMPDLSTEEAKQKQDDEMSINKFLRFNKNKPVLSLKDKRKRK